MSFTDLLASEPPVTIQRQVQPGTVDENGIPVHGLVNVPTLTQVFGRLIYGSARQKSMWMSLGIEADYEFLTQEPGILNGHFILTADGRLFRVTGARVKRYGKGSIPTSYKFPCVETNTGATSV